MHLAMVSLDTNYAHLNTDGGYLGEFNGRGNILPPDHPSTQPMIVGITIGWETRCSLTITSFPLTVCISRTGS